MSRSTISGILLSAAVMVSLVVPAEVLANSSSKHRSIERGTTAGSKVTLKHKRKPSMSNAYLVPPPPAYMPTILPEHHYMAVGALDTLEAVEPVEPPPENPYKKYIYTPNENDTPHVTPCRNGVSNWARTGGSGANTWSKDPKVSAL